MSASRCWWPASPAPSRGAASRVRPFKPQNMSNNAAVTADGGEIGRAQALQARAARVAPSVHMNPVLLKPQSEIGAQVVVQGKVVGNARAREYQSMKPKLLGAVLESFGRLAAERRSRAGRRGGLGFGSEPARRRHRQHGLRARRRRSRRAGGRHRPRRRHRQPGRHQGRHRSGRRGDDRGLHRQPLPRRSLAVRRRHEGGNRPSYRVAGAGAGAVLRGRASPAGGGRAGTSRRHDQPAPDGADAHRRAGLSAHRQFRRFRSAAARTRRRSRLRAAGRADTRRRFARHPARLESHHRRSGRLARPPDGTSTSQAHLRRGGHVLGICGGYQMLGRESPIPTASRVRPPRSTGSACSRSKRCWKATRCWSRSRARRGRGRAVQGLRDACRPHHRRPAPAAQARQRPGTTAR